MDPIEKMITNILHIDKICLDTAKTWDAIILPDAKALIDPDSVFTDSLNAVAGLCFSAACKIADLLGKEPPADQTAEVAEETGFHIEEYYDGQITDDNGMVTDEGAYYFEQFHHHMIMINYITESYNKATESARDIIAVFQSIAGELDEQRQQDVIDIVQPVLDGFCELDGLVNQLTEIHRNYADRCFKECGRLIGDSE